MVRPPAIEKVCWLSDILGKRTEHKVSFQHQLVGYI